MSQQSFVDFYENYLNSPEGEGLRAKMDSIADAEEFCASVTAAGTASGYDFTEDDVRQVMRASEAQMAKAVAEANGELSEEQLDAVAGGATMFNMTSIPKVNIRTIPRYIDPGQFEMRTVMCPW